MPTQSFRVTSYSVFLSPNINPPNVALIDCYATIVTQQRVLQIYFVAPGNPLPPNRTGEINATAEQLPWYLDLLRNEALVEAQLDSDVPANNMLKTLGARAGWGHVVGND